MSVAGSLDLVGFGEAMVLVAPSDGLPLTDSRDASLHVAGAELNVCAAAASLGLSAAFASRVGADPLGARVIAAARRLGVQTGLIGVDDDRPTGVFFKDVQADGARRVYYYRTGSAASGMTEADADRVLAARPRVVVVSGITVALGDGPKAAVRRLFECAAGQGVRLALDPNLRPALGPIEAQAEALREFLSRTDLLLLGADEAAPLFGVAAPDDVFAAAGHAGVAQTVLKTGADGCYVRDGGGVAHVPTAAVTVIDPVGAGDAFAGGYVRAWLSGASALTSARLGTAVAARVVATVGDTDGLPDAEEAERLVAAALG